MIYLETFDVKPDSGLNYWLVDGSLARASARKSVDLFVMPDFTLSENTPSPELYYISSATILK